MGDRVRTHFVLPRETLEEFDRRVPSRKRSETVTALLDEWLRRERAKEILNYAGFMKDEDYPEFATSEDIYQWVRKLRNEWRNPWDEVDKPDGQGQQAG